MGKKAQFKKIRRLASAMPVIPVSKIQGTHLTGAELLEKGVKDVKGEEIDPEGRYTEKKVVKVPLNHNRKMKKLYYLNGMAGVGMYLNAVKWYEAKMSASK